MKQCSRLLLALLAVLPAGGWSLRPLEQDGLVASIQPHPAGQEWTDRWFAWPRNQAGVQLDRYRYYPLEPLARAMLVAPQEGSEPASSVKLEVLNAAGKPVRSETLSVPARFSTLDLRLAGLRAGQYFLRATFTSARGKAWDPVSTPFIIRGDEWTVRPARRATVPLVTEEPSDRPEAGRWPVTFGVPFPRNALFDAKHVRVVDEQGREVPSASQVTATWYRESPCVKWLLLDLQRPFGPSSKKKSYRLEFGQRVKAGPPLASLVRSADGNQVTVDTGVLRFTIRKDRPSVIEAAWLDGQQVVFPGEGTAAFWVDEQGTRYEAVRDGERALVVETDNPLRVEILSEGRYVNPETGKELSRFVLRVAAFRDQPLLRLYHTLIWTTDDRSKIAQGSLSFATAAQPVSRKVRFGLEGKGTYTHDGLSGGERLFLVQDRWDHFSLGRGSTALTEGNHEDAKTREDANHEGRQAAGWMESDNGRTAVGLCQRFFWQQAPGGLEAGADRVIAHWYPPQIKPLSFAARDVIAEIWMQDPQYGEKSVLAYPEGFLNTDPRETPDPFGLAKTHEVWLNFRHTNRSAEEVPSPTSRDTQIVNDLVQRPAFLLASPDWMCSTAIEGPMAARDEKRWAEFEEACDLIFRNVAMVVPAYEGYHWINFGDVHQEFPGPYRHWACNGYDWPMVPWIQLMRTGKRMYLENGEANTRHFLDLDTCHADKPREFGFPKITGGQYQYAGIHWTYGPLAEGHTMFIDHELWYYYLTGFRRAWDVAMQWGDLKKRTHGVGGVPCYHGESGEREATKPADPLLGLYEATWDPYFYDLGRRFYEMATGPQNAQGGFGNYGPGDSYTDIMTYRTLSRWALYTGEPEHEARVVRWARGKGLDRFNQETGWGIPPTEPVGLAAYYSKDPAFASYARYIAEVIARGTARTDDPFTVGSCSGRGNMRWVTFFRGLPGFVWVLNRWPAEQVPELRNPALGLSAILPPPEEYRREGWGELHLAYVQEAEDRSFRLRIQFATHQTEGVFLMRIVGPNGQECFRRLDGQRNPSGVVELPADGRCGTYRIECYSKGGNWNNGMRVTGDLPVVYAYSPATHLCGWGPLYLLAQPDATEVSVDILLFAGQAKLWAPDGTLLAATAPISNGEDPLARSNPPLTAKIKPEWRGQEFRLDFGPAGFPYTYLRGLKGFEPFLAQEKGQAFVPPPESQGRE